MKKLALLLALLGTCAAAHPGQSDKDEVAQVAGPVHASAFAEGLYLLHNFEYDRAAEAFRKAQLADPANVMAYWGEAMTYNHPLWAFQDTARAREVLSRLGRDSTARLARARTAREREWLGTVETLYGSGDKVSRDRSYHARLMAMHLADPADVDARSFAALATLGLASEGRDTATYMKAAALLEEGFAANPEHPGLLHYMIHSYDDPAHAPLGLRAARRYALVAPDAGHAQHMVSHIYLALGDWAAVEPTNVQAVRVVNAQRAAKGRQPAACGHYNEWLIYAQDQQGKDSQARVEACGKLALAEQAAGADKSILGADGSQFNSWAMIASRHGADTGRWVDPAVLGDGNDHLLGRFDLTYAALVAARADAGRANAALGRLRSYRDRILEALPRERPDDHESAPWFDLAVLQGEGIAALAAGNHALAIEILRQAAQKEAALPQPFGPPVLGKPSHELLGDALAEQGRSSEAAEAYRLALARMPNRRHPREALDRLK